MPKVYALTHDTLTSLLDFDPVAGVFAWKVARSNRVKAGSRAGVLHRASGGRYITIGAEKFMAHRLAWFYVHKRWPNTDVRPNDGNYDNCALSNLTEVSRVDLAHQRGLVRNNTSGFSGVSRARGGKWQAKVTWNYKQVNLGAHFETAEDAAECRAEAERRLASARTEAERDAALAEVRLWKGQRTAWRFLERSGHAHTWASFEEFCADVRDVPNMRYSIIPVDASMPMSGSNFRWAFPDGTTLRDNEARRRNRGADRNKELKRIFGIDFAEYQRMLLEQNGVCAICEKPETKTKNGGDDARVLSVDHNHSTGAVRGLLCANCNMGIGYLCDDPEVLRKAIAYLNKHSGKQNVVPFEVVNGVLGAGA